MAYSWDRDDTPPAASGRSKGGYDYASARKAYDSTPPKGAGGASASTPSYGSSRASAHMGSSYRGASRGATPPPKGKKLTTDSTHPLVVCMDITGSMTDKPQIILEKLPLLGKELERYAPDYAISFSCFGDAYCDSEPIQVREFDKGEALDGHLDKFYLEAGGGDNPETPDLLAYYYTHHCEMPKAVKPIFIFITDAPAHADLPASAIRKYIGDDVNEDLDSAEVLKKLGEKFSVYVIDCQCGYEEYWKEIYGEQKVKVMANPRDIIEFILGIVAGELGKAKDFVMRSSKRHADMPDRVERVMSSLKLDASTPPEDAKATLTGSKATASASKGKSKKLDAGEAPMKSKKLA